MKVTDTKIHDVKVIEPTVFEDERGFFFESFNQKKFEQAIGYSIDFVQDNHSKSSKGVLRGLHYQLLPHAQGKLVRVVRGAIYDVALDIRRLSPSFGQWVANELNEYKKNQIWIPEGFAHGFVTLTDDADVIYKATEYYSPKHERTILWSDPDISIDWPILSKPILSHKDQMGLFLQRSDLYS